MVKVINITKFINYLTNEAMLAEEIATDAKAKGGVYSLMDAALAQNEKGVFDALIDAIENPGAYKVDFIEEV